MVPNGWSSTKFGNLFSVKSGFGFKFAEYSKTGIPLIKIDNVSYGYVKWDNISYLPESYTESYSDIVLKENDILLALNRPITQGKLKLVKLTANDVPSILYQRVGRIDFNSDGLDKDFYYFYLNSAIFEFVSRKSIGSDQPFISLTELKKLKISKPPLSEQQKIAKILTTWDKAIDTTERLIDNSKQQKKALMQQLLTGKKRLLDEDGKRFEGEWENIKLKDIAEIKRGAGSQYITYINNPDFGIRLIRISDFLGDSLKYIKNTSDIDRFKLKKGDLLIAGTGATAGIVFNVPDELVGLPFSYNAPRIRVNQSTSKTFVFYYLRSDSILSQQLSLFTGNAQPFLDTKAIGGFNIKLPPLAEQQKIAAVLTTADKEIELLEQQLADLQQEKKALMQVLLTGKKRVVVDG